MPLADKKYKGNDHTGFNIGLTMESFLELMSAHKILIGIYRRPCGAK